MRTALALLLVTSTAYADREGLITLGGTFANAPMNESYDGRRLSLSFDPKVPHLGMSGTVTTGSLVPELFVGDIGNYVVGRAKVVGVGARLEAHVHHESITAHVDLAVYLAARGESIGGEPGGELMAGGYYRVARFVIGAELGAWGCHRRSPDPLYPTGSFAGSVFLGVAL